MVDVEYMERWRVGPNSQSPFGSGNRSLMRGIERAVLAKSKVEDPLSGARRLVKASTPDAFRRIGGEDRDRGKQAGRRRNETFSKRRAVLSLSRPALQTGRFLCAVRTALSSTSFSIQLAPSRSASRVLVFSISFSAAIVIVVLRLVSW
jgi:hypothetical protein